MMTAERGGNMRDRYRDAGVLRRSTVSCLLATFCVLTLAPGGALRGESVAAQQRREAEETIPWAQISPEAGEKLRRVVSRPTLFRHLPEETIECDPKLFVFLVRHPEVIVNMWRIMGVTKCDIARTGNYTFDASDGAGTKSKVELIYYT